MTLSVRAAARAAAAASDCTSERHPNRLNTLLGHRNRPRPLHLSSPGHEIDERYQALRDFVSDRPGAPIDQVLRELGDAQQQIAKLAATTVSPGSVASSAGGVDPLLALKTDAARQPQPLGALAHRDRHQRRQPPERRSATAACGDLQRQRRPGRAVPAVVNGHYPFTPTTTTMWPIDDFARLFAPGGALDGFVNTLLRRYVDMSGKTWRLTSADAASAPVPAGRPRAVPTCRVDPRRVLRRRWDTAALSPEHHAGQRRSGDAAGDARSRRHYIAYTARTATVNAGDLAELLPAADDAAGIRAATAVELRGDRPMGAVPAVRLRADAGATWDNGPLHADVPIRRSSGGLRPACAGIRQSVRAGSAAGLSLSERACQLTTSPAGGRGRCAKRGG